ncbi:MAG: prepilin-type N-terminal cleavage/methylation domain-containing protein [Fibrobacteria bacterium]|nr:prepilin-type N-terminal cleavage/methylation domain-containing protein [Fibrobacteria bacterium]
METRGIKTATRFHGFTFVEVMVVVALIGILAAITGPKWSNFISRSLARGAVNDLRGALLTARSDALTRKRFSGIVLDFSGHRFLRFVDSSGVSGTTRNCRFDNGERILQDWQELPSRLLFHQQASSMSPEPPLRSCDNQAGGTVGTAQSGSYAIVFRPDGSSCATLAVKMGARGNPNDTFRLAVFPATGMVTVEN